MNRIERYLASVVLTHTLLVMLVLLSLIGFSEFVNEMTNLTDDYTLLSATAYVLLKLPSYAYQMFPVALLIGTLMGLGGLANQSELTVLRVTGWSVGRLFWSVAKAALLFWLVITLIGETLATQAESYAEKSRAESLNEQFSMGKNNAFWVKNQQRYIEIGQALATDDLRNVAIYRVENAALVEQQSYARVRFIDQNWVADRAHAQTLGWWADPRYPEYQWLQIDKTNRVDSKVDLPFLPEDLENLTAQMQSLNVVELQDQIRFLQENGGDASQLELAYWKKMASPMVVLAMIAIVFPLIFGSQRQVSMGQRIFVGVLIGLMFHLGNQLLGNLSVIYQVPAAFAALLPAGILLTIALIWLRWQK